VDAFTFFFDPAGVGHACFRDAALTTDRRNLLASGRSDAWDVSLLGHVLTKVDWTPRLDQQNQNQNQEDDDDDGQRQRRTDEDAVVQRLCVAHDEYAGCAVMPLRLPAETYARLSSELIRCLAGLGENEAELKAKVSQDLGEPPSLLSLSLSC
jgi:hypothetical protein